MKADKKPQENEDKSLEEETKQLETLLEAMRLVEEKKSQKKPPKKPKGFISIEFGRSFHSNYVVNFLAYYALNLLVMYSVVTVLNLGEFASLEAVLLFVLLYTLSELLYKTVLIKKSFTLIMRTFGLIFFLGYVLIVVVLDQLVFKESVVFYEAPQLIGFVVVFMIVRYIIAMILRKMIYV